MRVPLSWLREYVSFDASPEDLARRLTFSGSEVTAIERVGRDFRGVVVGEVLDAGPLPNAERLRLCHVTDGRTIYRVVCGAFNFGDGDKVAFAPPGATLPGETRIERTTVRGEASEGMLCAEDELGLSADHSGVMVLPRGTRAGTPLDEAAGTADVVLDIDITWNRPDCLSIIGMAREVAALFGARLQPPPVTYPESTRDASEFVSVAIEDPVGCPRYTARVLSDVKLGPSPAWMRRRLELCGVRAISNVVDITNYVMLECGQPLHAFDYAFLTDRQIVVRRARAGETLTTIDGVVRPMSPEVLAIADAKVPVAVAGVMGGAGSEISGRTRCVLLESACFGPADIRRSSSRLGLATESSYRFERGVDIERADWGSRRAAALMVEHAGAVVARGVVDICPGRAAERTIAFRFDRIRRLLGVDVSDDAMAAILESLDLPVVERRERDASVRVPVFRGDLEIEADLAEEVARIHGLDKVPAAPPQAPVASDVDDTPTRAMVRCRTALAGLGLSEIMNYSFVSEKLLDLFDAGDPAARVKLPNPVRADQSWLRDSLMAQMVETLGRNLAHQVSNAAFFEMGRVFRRAGKTVEEEERLSLGLMGQADKGPLEARRANQADDLFLRMKGAIEAMARTLHVPDVSFAPCARRHFEAGQAVSVASCGQTVGELGMLSQAVRNEWRMNEPVAVAELRLAPLLQAAFRLPAARPLPVYPSVSRDVAMVVAEDVTHERVLGVIRKNAPSELTSMELFDIFRGEAIGRGRKSLAYTLVFRSLDRTLTDEEANGHFEAIKAALRRELQAEMREG